MRKRTPILALRFVGFENREVKGNDEQKTGIPCTREDTVASRGEKQLWMWEVHKMESA